MLNGQLLANAHVQSCVALVYITKSYFIPKHSIHLTCVFPHVQFASFPTTSVNPLSQSWASPKMLRQQTPPLGVGVGVSMATMKEGWSLSSQDRRRYTMQFNTLDKRNTGKLSGQPNQLTNKYRHYVSNNTPLSARTVQCTLQYTSTVHSLHSTSIQVLYRSSD